MFIVTGEDGTCYEFTFDEEKPEGLDSVNVGDKVTVTYTGTVSEVDPFEGEVLSVEAAEKRNIREESPVVNVKTALKSITKFDMLIHVL